MKVVCFGFIVMALSVVVYRIAVERVDEYSPNRFWMDYGFMLLTFFGGGLVLVGMEGM